MMGMSDLDRWVSTRELRDVTRRDLEGDAPAVAPWLLNKVLIVGACAGRIIEVEAYTQNDPASHTFGGQTKRNAVMFGPAGLLYVYFTYGMHYCANVVTGSRGVGEAVLLRAVQPLCGVALMSERRSGRAALADGPAKLCQAFGIGRSDDGRDLCAPSTDHERPFRIVDDSTPPPSTPQVGQRIGITKAVDVPWRWRL